MGLLSFFRKIRASSLIYRQGAMEVYSNIDNNKAIDEGYNANTAVHSIVKRDAQKFGAIPRFVYDASEIEEKAGKKERKAYKTLENDLSKLLNRPNPFEGQDIFFTKVRTYERICGEAFIWLNRGDIRQGVDENDEFYERDDEQMDKMPVLEMYVLPANIVTVVPDPDNLYGVLGYVLELQTERVKLRKGDVIHWKGVNLNWDSTTREHQRGFPLLTPGYKTLQQNNDATNSAVRMYQNDGAKGLLFNETFDKLTPVQQSQIKGVVDSKVNTNENKGSVATLQGKWGYVDIGGSSVDLQLLEGKELSWKELCFLFEVPYEFFNSDTTFANKEQAQKGWVSNTIIPACKQLDGELNRVLLKAFGLDKLGLICSDASGLPEMQKDMAQLSTALSTAWWITPNEKREEMGYESLPEPQMDEVWVTSGQPLSQMNDSAEMERITNELMNDQIGKDDGA
jgi:HK97 family phage portal protein